MNAPVGADEIKYQGENIESELAHCHWRRRAGSATATVTWAAKPAPGTSTGTGTVFFPNPVAQLQNQSLTDQKDADYAALQPAYHDGHADEPRRQRLPRGDWANVVLETGSPAYSPTNTFIYHRDDDRFEQVMAYYWVTEAQKYIQSLGFGSDTARRSTRSRRTSASTSTASTTRSPGTSNDLLRFGKGGVDDAEDAEVILHEYGHAIQDSQVAGFGSSPEAGAIGEGFGDYWAVTVDRRRRADGPTPRASPTGTRSRTRPTVPHCLRRVDTDKHYPEDLDRRGARRRPDLVARAVGHPPGARREAGRHDDPRGAVRLRARHDVRAGAPTRRSRRPSARRQRPQRQ